MANSQILITFGDKVKTIDRPDLLPVQKIEADNVNEIKSKFNQLSQYLADAGFNVGTVYKVITGPGSVDINPATGAVTILNVMYAEGQDGTYKTLAANHTEPIRANNGNIGGFSTLVYDSVLNVCYFVNYTVAIDLSKQYILGFIYDMNPQTLRTLSIVTVNGKAILPANLFIAQPTGETLLPSKIWMLSGVKQAIYKSGYLRNRDEMGLDLSYFQTFDSFESNNYNDPVIEFMGNRTILDPAVIRKTFVVRANIPGNRSQSFFNVLTPAIVNPSAIPAQTIPYSGIGDSIYNRGFSQFLNQYLATLSPTQTGQSYGVMTNYGGTNERGEGREGWKASNIIGLSNIHSNGQVITRNATPAPASSSLENPFLKPATATDKQNHPDWCFRNTGAARELSYVTDTNKNGDFFIFDYGYYAANNSIPATLKFMFLALSTNDFIFSSSTALADCKLALQIMLTQITAYLPNVKIAVIPTYSAGVTPNDDVRWSNTADYINAAYGIVAGLNNTKINVLALHPYIPRDVCSYAYQNFANLRSDGNNTLIGNPGDPIHFDPTAGVYNIIAKTAAAWMLNRLVA